MGDKAGAPATGASADRTKITVYLGTATVKRKKADGSYDKVIVPVLANVRKVTQDKFNLVPATAAQMQVKVGDDIRYYDGCFHGKTVVLQGLAGDKTPKGKIQTFSFPVPGYATRKVLMAAFTNTKVERWKYAGGRMRSAPAATKP